MKHRIGWALALWAAAGIAGCSDEASMPGGVTGTSGVGVTPAAGVGVPAAGAAGGGVSGAPAAGAAGSAGVSAPVAGAAAPVAGAPGVAGGGASGAPATAGASGAAAGGGTSGGAAGGGVAGGGAAGMVAGGPTGAPTFTAIFKEILTVGSAGNCMFGGCHGSPPDAMLNGGLTIMFDDQAGAYKNLFNVASTSTLCMGRKLVVPGDPGNSLLIQKFSEMPPCGVKMPIGRPLTAAQIKQIVDWITAGAMNN